jgi:hypothetical protein
LLKIGSGFQKLIGEQTHRQDGNLISLLFSFRKEYELKTGSETIKVIYECFINFKGGKKKEIKGEEE